MVQQSFNDGLNNHDLSVAMKLLADCIFHMPLVGDLSMPKTSFAVSQLNLHGRSDILQTLCLRSFSRCSVHFRQGFRTRAAIQAEILVLRHQLLVLQRSVRTHKVRLTASDRFLWVWLSRLWREWRSALLIVKPETVIAWHRRGFRVYWSWKSRHPQGRPSLSREVIDLIRRMSLANPRWGASRIHGELLKLGFELSEATVAKYMAGHRKPPSQTWRTFLANHMKDMVSSDFFVEFFPVLLSS